MLGVSVRIPKWESELWSYVSSGNGEHCPLYTHCDIRQRGGWCPDDNREYLNLLLDNDGFNFNNCDSIKWGTCGRVFQLVERLAQKYLKQGRIRCPPVPTVFIALTGARRAIEVRSVPLKVYHGAIWRLREGWVIQLKADDLSSVKRFTLFHEAFHILAHCRTIPVFKKRGITQGSFNELLADHFAICTLMPREWVKEKWAESKDLDRMAEIFDAPKSAMYIRLRQLGLI